MQNSVTCGADNGELEQGGYQSREGDWSGVWSEVQRDHSRRVSRQRSGRHKVIGIEGDKSAGSLGNQEGDSELHPEMD